MTKAAAGWVALFTAVGLAIVAAIARWHASMTASGTEATIIYAFLTFSATAFGLSTVEPSIGKKSKKKRDSLKELHDYAERVK